ncbi:recombinase family protein [Phenylobacterium sp. J367]|uniref:recombinase family protein n=1 Tax=Phenylobacterium sp. J367 TaxID=2898435 RepID=UPI002151CC0A|nr:recombinase family protein [Phenylobacterium sp. J367]MCR5879443.1 recombinase family protein [Phenylobacterium sp. J367]
MPTPVRPRAAQYLRMSTEHQNYSLEFQAAANAAYAAEHGLQIVQTYTDAGISGLRLQGRDGLKQLLADVLGGGAPYATVLVYDVSRWGRFQDVDQGAHYEFVCREAGVEIIYTAEPFPNDGSLSSAILKQLKRAMAAEYSRELSVKVGRAKRGLRLKGYWPGGPAGYGFRRLAVSADGREHHLMQSGQHKAFRGLRTILVPGPPEEVATVRRIYSLFVVAGMRTATIADLLNGEGVPGEGGVRWTFDRVRRILTSEKYAGVLVLGKTEGMLTHRWFVPRKDWVRVEGAVAPLVTPQMFALAQRQFHLPRSRRPTQEALLDELRRVWIEHGRISTLLINSHPETHCSATMIKTFGSMDAAYARLGYTPSRRQRAGQQNSARGRDARWRGHAPLNEEEALIALARHWRRVGRISANTIDADPELASADWFCRRFGGMANVYARLGYTPDAAQQRHLDWHARRQARRGALTDDPPDHRPVG